ncbi:hypothetical protein [Acetobacter orientalis]|nr:hypothetical protein [Acetobacter orientalis]
MGELHHTWADAAYALTSNSDFCFLVGVSFAAFLIISVVKFWKWMGAK